MKLLNNKRINWKFITIFVLISLALILGLSTLAKNAPLSNLSSPSPTITTVTTNAASSPVGLVVKTTLPTASPEVIQYSNGSCHSANGEPDLNCTPGAANPNVTQANIQSTICVSGYTTTIRPSTSYTNKLKAEQIIEYGYADTNLSDYEEDHFIPLEVGGDPTNPKNLWPEYGGSPNPKDTIENLCHKEVCNGQINLAEAQREIVTNWHTACGGNITITPSVTIPVTVTTSSPTNTNTQNNGATALCKDGTHSYATSHQGACSHHGGVAQFYK
jgi:hypothetical protein